MRAMQISHPRHFAIVPAAGSGSRMAAARPKQYLSLLGRPLIHHALSVLCAAPAIDAVFVVLSVDDTEWATHDWSALGPKLRPLFCGGATRADSVLGGLRAIAGEAAAGDWVLVHDAARPCLAPWHVDKLVRELAHDEVGGMLAVPVADTLKRPTSTGACVRDRAARQPVAGADAADVPLRPCCARARRRARRHRRGGRGRGRRPAAALVQGDPAISRSPTRSTSHLAEWLLLRTVRDNVSIPFRIGQGFDVHALVAGPAADRRRRGHSLRARPARPFRRRRAAARRHRRAARRRRPGRHRPAFPDTDPASRRRRQPRAAARGLRARARPGRLGGGERRCHADLQGAPRILPHAPAMVANIAADLEMDAAAINIKGKTTEKLGFTGRGEGIAAQVVALIARAEHG
jgi:2-C-methyl-D-erythritol 4-phosphate cytidylyltransferase